MCCWAPSTVYRDRTRGTTEIPGWQKEWPPPLLQGRDPAQVQQFLQWNAALSKNPRDVDVLDNRGS